MSKKVKVQAPKLMPYPKEQEMRCGCKVSWYYYELEADAKTAAAAARHNSAILANQGYDFGYQAPGWHIDSTQSWFPGLFEVCIPQLNQR